MSYFKLEMFDEILEECSKPNWDGYGAEPISPISVIRAAHFCALLPERISTPDVVAEPDSQVALEWNSKSSDLSISFTEGDEIHFAVWFDGSSSYHGTCQFVTKIPLEILTLLERICKAT